MIGLPTSAMMIMLAEMTLLLMVMMIVIVGSAFSPGNVVAPGHLRMSSIWDFFFLSSFDDMCILSLFDDNTGKAMQIRTPLDLGLVIRDRRRKLKLSQTDLARKAGAGRQWVVAIEHGKSRAELGLVLRTLAVLGLSLTIDAGDRPPRPSGDIAPADIDAVVSDAKGGRQ